MPCLQGQSTARNSTIASLGLWCIAGCIRAPPAIVSGRQASRKAGRPPPCECSRAGRVRRVGTRSFLRARRYDIEHLKGTQSVPVRRDPRQRAGSISSTSPAWTRQKHYPTAFGSGVAMFDYDGDGRLDLYFATCTTLPLSTPPRANNRLYKNNGDGTFRDATAASGLGFAGFCHGIIAGDIDNDGDPDVFLCNYGSNVLFLNHGDGTFRDISHHAGIDRPNWSSGGAMLDYDNDGDLDIYVANYGEWLYPRDAHHCGSDRVPVFCSPWDVRTVKHFLYRNNGDRTFTDVTDRAGVGRSDGHGFGVVAADLNGDGRDRPLRRQRHEPELPLPQQGRRHIRGRHRDLGGRVRRTRAAAIEHGRRRRGLRRRRPARAVRDQLPERTHRLLSKPLRLGPGADRQDSRRRSYRESSAEVGLAADSKPWVGWGCALADFDNDGWPDSFVANGHVDDNRKDLAPDHELSRAAAACIAMSRPGDAAADQARRRFQLSTRDAGPYFATRHVGRGRRLRRPRQRRRHRHRRQPHGRRPGRPPQRHAGRQPRGFA